MVLDGAVDPSLDPIDENLRQMAGFQTAFEDYAADCAQFGRTARSAPTRRSSSTGTTSWSTRWSPQPARTSDPRGLSYQDAITGTVNALYSRQYWKFLTSGLLGLQRGTDPGDLLLLADDYLNRGPAGHYQNSQDAFYAIRCVNAPVPDRPGGVGRRRPTGPRGRAVPQLRVVHGFRSP